MSKHHKHRHEQIIEIKDPVCKMTVSPKSAADELDYGGQKFYFCSPGCRVEFEKAPEDFLPKQKLFRT